MTLVRIKRDTVRRNPNAGQTDTSVAGRSYKEVERYIRKGKDELVHQLLSGGNIIFEELCREGCPTQLLCLEGGHVNQYQKLMLGEISEIVVGATISRDVQHVRHAPLPDYLFEYEDAQVECKECHAKFSYTELKADCMDCGYDDEIGSNSICPKCGAWDCCEFKFEEVDEKWLTKS